MQEIDKRLARSLVHITPVGVAHRPGQIECPLVVAGGFDEQSCVIFA
jgi:hypothetical protein